MEYYKNNLFLSLFLVIFGTSSAVESELGNMTCTVEFCTTFNAGNCVTRLCNGFNTTKILNPNNPCDCCEYCIDNLVKGNRCYPTAVSAAITSLCGPGLSCQAIPGADEEFSCQEASTPCTQALDDYYLMIENGQVGVATVKPECDENGKFATKRCPYGLTCYCLDEENNRIFGEAAPSDPQSLTMNCECSRGYAKAETAGLLAQGFQRCLANGDFDPLQCVGDSCFCIDAKNEVTDGPVPRTIVDLLKCFDEDLHFLNLYDFEEHNFHPCELAIKRFREEELHQAKRNMSILGLEAPKCQADGYYYRIQEREGRRSCVDHLGHILNYNYTTSYTPDVLQNGQNDYRCNCARTAYILGESKSSQPKCCPNGSYRKWQCTAGKCFCVDPYGEQIESTNGYVEVNDGEEALLSCHGEVSCW